MNRTIKAILGAFLVLVIAFAAISIFQNVGKSLKADITQEKLYTLSDGTKNILAKLQQPIKMKLYYARTAALKGPDQIRYFNNYYQFVNELLQEYVAASKGMVELTVVDPRPFSEDEDQAMRFGLKKFRVTEEENFFFGLVLQTQFGVEKSIPFFAPDRQNFVEYDISYLIDTAITRQKIRVGILSSLPVAGDDVSGYMAQMMRMQGRNPQPAWGIVEQIKGKYEVKEISPDVEQIKDVDVLMVIHPKDFSNKTLFAIDQYVLKGGRTMVFVDPFCVTDQPDQMAMQSGQQYSPKSQLDVLINNWGLEMPADQYAGDMELALKASMRQDQPPQKIIGFMELDKRCFNSQNVITADLNQVRMLFSGVLNEKALPADPNNKSKIERTPLLTTTSGGNSWQASADELMMPDASMLLRRFYQGTKPVAMGYLVTGKFKSSFPDGVEVQEEPAGGQEGAKPTTKKLAGLKEASQDCVVAVFADVDFISDIVAYENSFFGKMVVGDNTAMILNMIDDLSGSSDLISIRSRGNFKRPFTLVDKIEQEAEKQTVAEEKKIDDELAGFQQELQKLVAQAMDKGQTIIDNSILQKRDQAEIKIRQLEGQKNKIKLQRRQKIDNLGKTLANINMLTAPAVILVIAIVLGVYRSVRKRNYIGHGSDA